jgi:voltage-gated potassium channel
MKLKIKAIFYFFLSFIAFIIFISFLLPKIDKAFHSFGETLYWAIVTVSTVGYGDITPTNIYSKIITVILIIYGLIAISLFGAMITAVLIEMIINRMKDWQNMQNVKNHIIICGYNSQTHNLIKSLKTQIVLIHDKFTPEIEALIEKYKIKFIEGDFSEEEILKKAKANEAAKAILISESEIEDAKILSAAILLKDLKKDIYIIAEIANPKFQVYLQKIHCDEVVLSKEYNANLLAKTTVSPGISKVIGAILKDENFYIKRYYGKKVTFEELFEEFLKKDELLIGIIENYARADEFIKEFIDEVKKEAKRLSEFVKYLEEIKHQELNKVILHPKKEYQVSKFCGLIILRRNNESSN